MLTIIMLVVFLLSGCGSSTGLPYIGFTQTSDNPSVYSGKSEPDQRPILIALASVMSPHETRQYYRSIAQ